ncbi:MAG TPA: YbfB/YjiJ family MFS transporter [Burkholderiaceae bacterium]|nr:YbfB/YjiJ family MFS transporter [Burkholderiaceae bacterium]
MQNPWALAIGGLLSMAAANGIDRFIYTPILPVMAEALGWTASQAGLIASANYLGYLSGALFAARPGLRGSRRRWLLPALATSAICTAGMALTASLPLMGVLRFVGGFAGAVAIIMATALVVDRLAAGGRGSLAPVHFAGVGMGIVVSAVIVAGLRFAGHGWRSMWLCAGVASLCCAACVASLIRNAAAVPAVAAPSGRWPAIGPRLGMLIAANTLSAFGYVITATFIVALVRSSPRLQPLEASIWVVFGLAAAPSVALWLWLARRTDVFRTFAAVCLVEAVGVLASVLWLEAIGTLVAAVCVGGSFMGLTALGMVGARTLTVGDARRPVALMTAGFGCGQMVGPTLAGYLHDASGSFLLPSLCAVASLVVAAILALGAAADLARGDQPPGRQNE